MKFRRDSQRKSMLESGNEVSKILRSKRSLEVGGTAIDKFRGMIKVKRALMNAKRRREPVWQVIDGGKCENCEGYTLPRKISTFPPLCMSKDIVTGEKSNGTKQGTV